MTGPRKAGPTHSILFLIASIAIALAVGELFPGAIELLDLYEFDRLVRTRTEKDTYSPKIVLVTIGDDEYTEYFGRESPLKVAHVKAFIDAILTFQPRVVAVDLMTDHWPGSSRDFNNSRPPTWIVWAAAKPVPTDSSSSTRQRQCFAMPRYTQDRDGTIRKQLLTVYGFGTSLLPSFALAVSRSARGESCIPAEAERKGKADDRIRFTGRHHLFRRFAAAKVLADAREKNPDRSPLRKELEDAIVLLGGTFKDARDSYKTPIGTRDGVEILAHAVESIDHPIQEWAKWRVALFELVIGATVIVGLAWLSARVKIDRRVRSLVVIVAPFALALVVSFVAFQYLGNVIAVAASFLGIPIGHFAEHWLGDRVKHSSGDAGRRSRERK